MEILKRDKMDIAKILLKGPRQLVVCIPEI